MPARDEHPAVFGSQKTGEGTLVAMTAPFSNLPVAFDVGAKSANAGAVLANLGFIAPDDIAWRVIAAINVEPVAVALQAKLFLAKTLLIGPQICGRAFLGCRESTQEERYGKNENKTFSQH